MQIGDSDVWAQGRRCSQRVPVDGGVCASGLNRVSHCVKGHSLTPSVQLTGRTLTALCSDCHAAQSSVIYSVIGA